MAGVPDEAPKAEPVEGVANADLAAANGEFVDGVPKAPVDVDDPNAPVDVEAPNAPVEVDAPNGPPAVEVEPKPPVVGVPKAPVDDEPNALPPVAAAVPVPSGLYWLQAMSYICVTFLRPS